MTIKKNEKSAQQNQTSKEEVVVIRVKSRRRTSRSELLISLESQSGVPRLALVIFGICNEDFAARRRTAIQPTYFSLVSVRRTVGGCIRDPPRHAGRSTG